MKTINQSHITWQQCTETNDSLLVTIDSCKEAFILYDTTISMLREEIALHIASITERDRLMATQEELIKHQGKIINKLRLHKGLLGTASVVLAIAVIVLII